MKTIFTSYLKCLLLHLQHYESLLIKLMQLFVNSKFAKLEAKKFHRLLCSSQTFKNGLGKFSSGSLHIPFFRTSCRLSAELLFCLWEYTARNLYRLCYSCFYLPIEVCYLNWFILSMFFCKCDVHCSFCEIYKLS